MTIDKITKEEAEAYYSSVEDEFFTRKTYGWKMGGLGLASLLMSVPICILSPPVGLYMLMGGFGLSIVGVSRLYFDLKKTNRFVKNLKSDVKEYLK
ncbi:MAG: hypothetical protein ABIC91_08360 [Nanoarchaeota archaeon]|nr:hypothetical protein [Nanoarchaeota archaeon]MBU1030350.1 hypothetical protein [Nanoarchaeota archaeon]MBU1849810.1 hypothetical protein [Nanoarchaeota archaeon]